MISLRVLRFALACGLLAASSTVALSQAWPTRPVTTISPFTAGNANDMVARVVLDEVSKRVGQPFVIENRTGAGGHDLYTPSKRHINCHVFDVCPGKQCVFRVHMKCDTIWPLQVIKLATTLPHHYCTVGTRCGCNCVVSIHALNHSNGVARWPVLN
jgi:hypothetical protein